MSRSTAVLAAASTCAALVVGFVAAVNLALPPLAGSELHPSAAALLWTVDAYVLVFACLVIPGGAAGDRFGRKGVLLAGLVAVAVGASVSALAPSVAVLVAGRVLAGVGAAAVLPNTLACLVHATPPPRRPAAIAVWASATGLGGVVGNVGGGAVLVAGGWRWLFVAAAAAAVVEVVVVALAVPVSSRTSRPLRPLATALITAGTLAVLLGIIEGPERGWTDPLVLVAFVAAVACYAGWARTELRADRPLLDPRLLAIPRLRGAALGMTVAFFGLFALFYVNASLLQYGRGFSAFVTGLGILPMSLPMLVVPRFVPRLAARVGATATVATAFTLIGGGLVGLGLLVTAPYAAYAVGLVVVGTGCAVALPQLSRQMTEALPDEQAGVAGGLQSTTRELGSALGVAVVGTVTTSAFAAALPAGAPHTVAAAFAVAPHAAVLAAFTRASAIGLVTVGIATLVSGALVIAQSINRALPTRRPLPTPDGVSG
jgi:MFS family permease